MSEKEPSIAYAVFRFYLLFGGRGVRRVNEYAREVPYNLVRGIDDDDKSERVLFRRNVYNIK